MGETRNEDTEDQTQERDELSAIEEAKERYFRSPKGREAIARYAGSEKGRRAQERYAKTSKGRLALRRYFYSTKGQDAHARRKKKVAGFKEIAKWMEAHPGGTFEEAIEALKETKESETEKDASKEE